MSEIKVGDSVLINSPGSWCHDKTGIVERLNVTSSDGITGCLLKLPEGVTVIEPEFLIDATLCGMPVHFDTPSDVRERIVYGNFNSYVSYKLVAA